MFKPGGPHNLAKARALRQSATDAERLLWWHLRQLNRRGCHFRQQVWFDPYVLDFAEHSAKLVVELDGEQHGTEEARAHDARRDAFLASHDYVTMRFWNHEVYEDVERIVEIVVRELTVRGKL
jgi:very-short-patch-repair endonuclease